MKIKFPTRKEDYSERYNQLVLLAGLAQPSSVRGCMVIKPYGYAIRENMRDALDRMFKKTWHQNAYFPLFIPKSYLSKEAAHIEWFAKECAVVTHHRLKTSDDGKSVVVDPEAKLEEELIVRPTSETIIRNTYKDRVQSHRDLPLLINQWANVVRREMRTRMFLRTSEFLRQEWHTAHASKQEAVQEAELMLDVYKDFMNTFLAIDPYVGIKSPSERFAGAEETYCLEAMMQDAKALQIGTSHFLGQNFAKAFDVTFKNSDNQDEYVWATSRWVSTRMMGGLIMSHSDDAGLVLPPALAPIHIVVVPVFKNGEELEEIGDYIAPLVEKLEQTCLQVESKYLWRYQIPLQVRIDTDDQKTLWRKCNEYELQGVPMRVTAWPRDMQSGNCEIYRRDTGEKQQLPLDKAYETIHATLHDIQAKLFRRNQEFVRTNTQTASSYDEFKEKIEHGFVLAHRDGTVETEEAIKEETKATIRCIPLNNTQERWKCIYSGKPSAQRVLFAKAY